MGVASTSRRWSFFWLFIAVFAVPFLLAPALLPLIDREYQVELGVILAMLGLLLWLASQGTGWRPVGKDTAVILRDSMDTLTAHVKRPYLFIPIVHKVEAILPTYPMTFEFPVEGIDTHTAGLGKISKIMVRATCQISDPAQFFQTSRAFVDRIRQMEEHEKLKRTDIALWRKLLQEIAHVVVDDTVRDVVWKWKLYLQDPSLVSILDYAPTKDDGTPNLDGDPYSLSRNRKPLADRVKIAIKKGLDTNQVGIQIDPLVFESVEIDGEIVKRATSDPKKERERESEKAAHEARLLAETLREQGGAEAEVRAKNLAAILKVLIEDYKIPHTDPLIGHVVRAALYSDGNTIWSELLDKARASAPPAKTP